MATLLVDTSFRVRWTSCGWRLDVTSRGLSQSRKFKLTTYPPERRWSRAHPANVDLMRIRSSVWHTLTMPRH